MVNHQNPGQPRAGAGDIRAHEPEVVHPRLTNSLQRLLTDAAALLLLPALDGRRLDRGNLRDAQAMRAHLEDCGAPHTHTLTASSAISPHNLRSRWIPL